MAYTIRTNEEDEKAIKLLMSMMNEKSASKVLLKSAKLLPAKFEKIYALEKKLKSLKIRLANIQYYKQEYDNAKSALDNLIDEDI
ncbi:hypothetical protein [Paraglaciecola marina]|uniref:hypothetical protein n=1 Tax=Paraglaciecola marina TaxID=2500157 RepID=UPI00106211D4|nr:hypothetical protein [Paraglaciecola marina]